MGDISAEPSMEDILSSIKRIIAEEGDAATTAARGVRKPARMSPTPRPDIDQLRDDFGHDEILELSDPMRGEDDRMPQSPPAYTPAATQPAPPAQPSTPLPSVEPILSPQATQATRGPLEALSRMIVKPEVTGSDTLEGLVRDMIRPMLREWMDANLPNMVEQMVAQEIARITGQQ